MERDNNRAINRGKQTHLLPPDEKSESLARSIANKDRVMSKASALRAASEEVGIVESVIRHLLNMLPISSETQVRTHILTGLDTICTKQKQFYEEIVRGLSHFDPSNNAAVGVAGNSLLSNAERTGVTVPSGLRSRFSKAAGALSAISGENPSKSQRH